MPLNRRQFLQTTGVSAAAIVLPSLEVLAQRDDAREAEKQAAKDEPFWTTESFAPHYWQGFQTG